MELWSPAFQVNSLPAELLGKPKETFSFCEWCIAIYTTLEMNTEKVSNYAFSSAQLLNPVWLFVTPWAAHARFPFPLQTPEGFSNSCPASQWCHPTISSSVIPFSSCLQSFPASGSFPMSQFFASGGQSIGASASIYVLNCINALKLCIYLKITLKTIININMK